MKSKTIYVLHESGNKEHYRALVEREKIDGNFSLVFREFSIFKLLFKGILRGQIRLIIKQFTNLLFLLTLPFLRNKVIIVGIAPYDYRLIFFYPFFKKNQYYYHTSKTSWGYINYHKRIMSKTKISKEVWTDFINNSKGVFCASGKVQTEILKYYNPQNTTVVNHALKVNYTEDRKEIKSKKIRCLFVGRLEKSKGVLIIFNLIEQLDKDKFDFMFVGAGSLENDIQSFCESKGNCQFLGFQQDPQLKIIYEKADFLLVPSLRTGPWEELFGMVLIEGMARGIIQISTNHTGPKEIIDKGRTGFLFSEEEYLTQTVKILISLSGDREKLKEMKIKAFVAGQRYNPSSIFLKWNELLQLN